MPPPAFFQKLGCFVRRDFLSHEQCAEICADMRRAAQAKGEIVGSRQTPGEPDLIDESVRRVLSAKVAGPAKALVKLRLEKLKAELENHFQVSLTGGDGPQFLRYPPNAFYHPHRDASPDSPPDIACRRVSVVVFLNRPSEYPAPDCYGGGALRFYGLLTGPHWENCAFSLEAEPGLLVAFRSDVLHEVLPVTFGERMTVVAWFIGD